MSSCARHCLTVAAAVLAMLCAQPTSANAQSSVTVSIVDQTGAAVPFAYVSLVGRSSHTADDSGRVSFDTRRLNELRFNVRRLGYYPLDTTLSSRSVDTVTLRMRPIARSLDAVTVSARPEDVLTQRGFYDRMMRVQRGAMTADFIGPEELNARNPMTVSRALSGSRYAASRTVGGGRVGRVIITGRGGCSMSILVDGLPITQSTQDITRGDPTSISPGGTRQTGQTYEEARLPDIDELLPGSEILAIEIYPSVANAPVELQRVTQRGSCGIVAIWTGGRGNP
ncbi:MAG: hypothetical protein KF689_02040 [Gemmatimonadaceae bacterium]|nr:hypothetical protein [Gemmatimonadaceae bacterium]